MTENKQTHFIKHKCCQLRANRNLLAYSDSSVAWGTNVKPGQTVIPLNGRHGLTCIINT